MKRLFNSHFAIVLSLFMLFLLLPACAAAPQVPDGMDTDRLYALARQTVDAANGGDYGTLVELTAEGGPAAEGWEESLAPVAELLGAFVAYKDENILTQSTEELGSFAVVLLEAEHEKRNALWQVSVTPDYKVIKLWVT